MTRTIFTTADIPFPHYEGRHGVAYRIEIDATEQHRQFQRHIWIYADGTERAEQWIAHGYSKPERLVADGFVQVAA